MHTLLSGGLQALCALFPGFDRDLAKAGAVPLRFSDTDHAGYGGTQLTKVEGGKAVFFGTPYTTDDGDSPVKPYEAQAVTPPQNGVPAA